MHERIYVVKAFSSLNCYNYRYNVWWMCVYPLSYLLLRDMLTLRLYNNTGMQSLTLGNIVACYWVHQYNYNIIDVVVTISSMFNTMTICVSKSILYVTPQENTRWSGIIPVISSYHQYVLYNIENMRLFLNRCHKEIGQAKNLPSYYYVMHRWAFWS